MYKCSHCNITFSDKNDDGILTFRGKMYCKQCEEPVVEVSDIPQNASAMHGAQATLISNSDNRITTNNYYGGGVHDEQVETPYGMFRKSEAYFCKQCRRWIPVMFFNVERGMCDGCVENEGVKALKDGQSFFDVGLYEEAVKEFIKYEPVCKEPKVLAQLQNYIGRCYYEKKQWTEAVKYFIKSLELNADSNYYIGHFFYDGLGVDTDRNKGLDYIKTAASMGSQLAIDFLEEKQQTEMRKLNRFWYNGKWGYKDKVTGEIVIPSKWRMVKGFYEGLCRVEDDNGKWGFIDKTGYLVVSCKWQSNTQDFHEGLARVEDDNEKYGYVDKMGKVVIPCKWKDTYSFHEGLARVKDDNGEWGFIDKMGTVVIPCKWKYTFSFHEGLARVKDDNGKWGFIDKMGTVVIPCMWKDVSDFTEGLARVKDDNGKWGFIDKNGKVIIACEWELVWDFHEGLAPVKKRDDNYGFIDKNGKIEECRFMDVYYTGFK